MCIDVRYLRQTLAPTDHVNVPCNAQRTVVLLCISDILCSVCVSGWEMCMTTMYVISTHLKKKKTVAGIKTRRCRNEKGEHTSDATLLLLLLFYYFGHCWHLAMHQRRIRYIVHNNQMEWNARYSYMFHITSIRAVRLIAYALFTECTLHIA